MDLFTKQLLRLHEARLEASLREAGLMESYYWLRVGDKTEKFESLEAMIARLAEDVPAPWKVWHTNPTYNVIRATEFEHNQPIAVYKSDDAEGHASEALNDQELRFLMAYRVEGKPLPNGISKGKEPSDFDPKALAMGTEIEMEHTKDRDVAQRIAMDHLSEDPQYYAKLKKYVEPKAEGETRTATYSKKFRQLTYFTSHNTSTSVHANDTEHARKIVAASGIDQGFKVTETTMAAGVGTAPVAGFVVGTAKLPKKRREKRKQDNSESDDEKLALWGVPKSEGEDSDFYHPDDDEPVDAEPSEPSEDDYVIQDVRGGGEAVYQFGKELFSSTERDEIYDFIRKHSEKEQFFPDVWWISDHGNANIVTADVFTAKTEDEPIEPIAPVMPTQPVSNPSAKAPIRKTKEGLPLSCPHCDYEGDPIRNYEPSSRKYNPWKCPECGKPGSSEEWDIQPADAEELMQSGNYEDQRIDPTSGGFEGKKKEAFGVTGTSDKGGVQAFKPKAQKLGKGLPCWTCGTPVISSPTCHGCGAKAE